MAKVTIRMIEGNVRCVGAVYRLLPGGGSELAASGVQVRAVKPSHALDLQTPGHYQYRFDAGGGSGPFKLVTTNEAGVPRGASDHPGKIQVGLVHDFDVP